MSDIKYLTVKGSTYQFHDEYANNQYASLLATYSYLGTYIGKITSIANDLNDRIALLKINIDRYFTPDKQYVTIECTKAPLQLGWGMITYNRSFSKTIEYSTDGSTWTQISSYNNGSYSNFPTLNNVGDKLYLRGTNSTYTLNVDYSNKLIARNGGEFNVYGNMMSLINKNRNSFKTLKTLSASYNFYRFFANTYVVNASNLILPATTLTYGCYNGMFLNCNKLTGVPALPATTLANSCYAGMFENCDSLVIAPVLPATTLASYCYARMFQGCTSLRYLKILYSEDLRKYVNGSPTYDTYISNWFYAASSGAEDGIVVVSDTIVNNGLANRYKSDGLPPFRVWTIKKSSQYTYPI